MNFFRYTKLYLFFSGFVIVASIASIAVFGLDVGIEFQGGSILEIEYAKERPSNQTIQEQLSGLDIGLPIIQPIGEKGVIIRTKHLSGEIQQVREKLGSEAIEKRFESIGPAIGEELRGKAIVLTLFSLVVISLYIAFAFRKVTQPVKFWQWSGAAFLTLAHDVLVALGVLALLGKLQGVEITIPIVVALLTVVGYSINDTVVLFDRIRENLVRKTGVDFQDTVNKSLRQTLFRSFSISFTVMLSLFAIFFFGGETVRYFSLTLLIGIGAGSYSSLFMAPALLITWVGSRRAS
ncbi:MAG: protein translocase subunit SecF [Patescibacteria group bacterium]